MMVFKNSNDMKRTVASWQEAKELICLVPTMGSIHAGHLALINRARQLGQRVVVSIYVNPTQFAVDEDFKSYPRDLQADKNEIASAGGVDAIYAPQMMYNDAHATNVVPAGVALPMEGVSRPHFFTGVATIVFKLFQHIPADIAIFGEKDFQQFTVLRQMVTDFELPISVITHPTLRESDGLAISSRNQYLTVDQRVIAPILYETLCDTSTKILAGAGVEESLKNAKANLLSAGFSKIDYFDLREPVSLTLTTKVHSDDRLFVAAWLGDTRLIDNYALNSNILNHN